GCWERPGPDAPIDTADGYGCAMLLSRTAATFRSPRCMTHTVVNRVGLPLITTAEVLIAVAPYTRHWSSVAEAAGVVIGCPAISVIRCCFVLTTPSAPVTRKSSVVYLPHSSAFPAHCAAWRASAAFFRDGSD